MNWKRIVTSNQEMNLANEQNEVNAYEMSVHTAFFKLVLL